MTDESWEDKCCRCETTKEQSPTSGRRACHLSCGTCIYPEDWSRCVSCELVGHCALALAYLKSLNTKKGCVYVGQLTGEESLYHILDFVNGQQVEIAREGPEEYLKRLREANRKSKCMSKTEEDSNASMNQGT